MKKAILFDLDETLLAMDQEQFERAYFLALAKLLVDFNIPLATSLPVLKQSVWAMIQNQGLITNEHVFWAEFESGLNLSKMTVMPTIEKFYQQKFKELQPFTTCLPLSALIIQTLKSKGYRLILATNPLFPMTATYQRLAWANLNPTDFELITTYENSHYAKPNPAYFTEILTKQNLTATDCLMIGNSVEEDLAALKVGIDCYLITNELDQSLASELKQLNLAELSELIKAWPELS